MKDKPLRTILWLFLAAFLPLSCGQKEVQQEEKLEVSPAPEPLVEEEDEELVALEQRYQELMQIHDRAMERMSEIRHLSKQLEDSIEHTSVNPMEQEEAINNYRNQLRDLKQADQAMRQWMREFNYEEEMAREQKKSYLADEMEKMKQVDQQINEAIKGARESLQP